jgi:hypothetical protein
MARTATGSYPALGGSGGLRRAILGIVIALTGSGCAGVPSLADPPAAPEALQVRASASPFSQVTAGSVRALVPDGWRASPAGGAQVGFVASPRPDAWRDMDGSISGMAATWVDATEIGVPSDFYYLAATGPLMSRLTRSNACRAESQRVFLDHAPVFAAGAAASNGDYMARGEGTCHVDGRPTRWAYFVAAPGFGPVRSVGIPQSGLYVVVAVMRDSQRASAVLDRLITHTSFGGTLVRDFVSVAGGKFRAS